jgi:hypothetical protein
MKQLRSMPPFPSSASTYTQKKRSQYASNGDRSDDLTLALIGSDVTRCAQEAGLPSTCHAIETQTSMPVYINKYSCIYKLAARC